MQGALENMGTVDVRGLHKKRLKRRFHTLLSFVIWRLSCYSEATVATRRGVMLTLKRCFEPFDIISPPRSEPDPAGSAVGRYFVPADTKIPRENGHPPAVSTVFTAKRK